MRIRHPTLPIVLTLLLGTGLSILATLVVARWEHANYRLQFQRQTDGLTTALQRSINRYTDLLLALGDFYTVSEQNEKVAVASPVPHPVLTTFLLPICNP